MKSSKTYQFPSCSKQIAAWDFHLLEDNSPDIRVLTLRRIVRWLWTYGGRVARRIFQLYQPSGRKYGNKGNTISLLIDWINTSIIPYLFQHLTSIPILKHFHYIFTEWIRFFQQFICFWLVLNESTANWN